MDGGKPKKWRSSDGRGASSHRRWWRRRGCRGVFVPGGRHVGGVCQYAIGAPRRARAPHPVAARHHSRVSGDGMLPRAPVTMCARGGGGRGTGPGPVPGSFPLLWRGHVRRGRGGGGMVARKCEARSGQAGRGCGVGRLVRATSRLIVCAGSVRIGARESTHHHARGTSRVHVGCL
jgi:hypothetical protein